jgi:hypothetical protein
MNAKRTVAVALAALLVVTGVVAATPAGQAGSHADEAAAAPDADTEAEAGADVAAAASERDGDASEGASDEAEESGVANGSAAASGPAADTRGERGPPETLPAPVPDHVSDVHHTVDAFLSGDLNGTLGDALSALLGGGGEATDAEANATVEAGPETAATATATPA